MIAGPKPNRLSPKSRACLLGFVVVSMLLVLGLGPVLVAWSEWKLPPLHTAASVGDFAHCEQLVRGGVSINATDEDGNTALSFAVFYCKSETVRGLIAIGADVNHPNHRGFTPLMYTSVKLRGRFLNGTEEQRSQIAVLLIEHGANVNHALPETGVVGSGQTALSFAASDGNVSLVRTLLAAGANPAAKEAPHGWTPADMARFSGKPSSAEIIRMLEEAAVTTPNAAK